MKHLSTSTTVREIEIGTESRFIIDKSSALRSIFEGYIRKNRPNAPGAIFVPSYSDTNESYPSSSEKNSVEDFLKIRKWHYGYSENFYLSDEQAQEIIQIWRNKRPDIKLSWETINLKTYKFLWFGGKSFTVKMWLISWD